MILVGCGSLVPCLQPSCTCTGPLAIGGSTSCSSPYWALRRRSTCGPALWSCMIRCPAACWARCGSQGCRGGLSRGLQTGACCPAASAAGCSGLGRCSFWCVTGCQACHCQRVLCTLMLLLGRHPAHSAADADAACDSTACCCGCSWRSSMSCLASCS